MDVGVLELDRNPEKFDHPLAHRRLAPQRSVADEIPHRVVGSQGQKTFDLVPNEASKIHAAETMPRTSS